MWHSAVSMLLVSVECTFLAGVQGEPMDGVTIVHYFSRTGNFLVVSPGG